MNVLYACHIHEPAEDGPINEDSNITVKGSYMPADLAIDRSLVYFEDLNGNVVNAVVPVAADPLKPGYIEATVRSPRVAADTPYLLCLMVKLPSNGTVSPYRKHAIRVFVKNVVMMKDGGGYKTGSKEGPVTVNVNVR